MSPRASGSESAASSNALHQHGNALTDADAHRSECITRLALLQFVNRRGNKARAAHAKRMSQSNRAAVGIDAGIVVRDVQLAQDREPLRGKRLVQFDDVELVRLDTGLRYQLVRGRQRTDAHDARRTSGGGD